MRRAFGDPEYKEQGPPFVVTATPEVQTVLITPEVEFVILATDGMLQILYESMFI